MWAPNRVPADIHAMLSQNARRIGDVATTSKRLFLFNHFVAEDDRYHAAALGGLRARILSDGVLRPGDGEYAGDAELAGLAISES